MDADQLYRDYLAGEPDALEQLMERYGDRLTLYISGYVKDLHEAEDLMIEVFAYLVDRKPQIRENFNAYVYRAARSYALMFLRKAKHHLILTQEETDFSVEDTFQTELLRKERDAALYRCMDRLPGAQREALYLVYVEEMSYQNAALVLHKTEKQVDKLLQLGKKNLRGLLEKEGVNGAFYG